LTSSVSLRASPVASDIVHRITQYLQDEATAPVEDAEPSVAVIARPLVPGGH
jgi:hypothetical protein